MAEIENKSWLITSLFNQLQFVVYRENLLLYVIISWLLLWAKVFCITTCKLSFLLDNPTTDEKFHEEFNPPTEGSYTGLGKQEKVLPVSDHSNDKEQIQQRYVVQILQLSFKDFVFGVYQWVCITQYYQGLHCHVQLAIYDYYNGLFIQFFMPLLFVFMFLYSEVFFSLQQNNWFWWFVVQTWEVV